MISLCVTDASVRTIDDIARNSRQGPWLLATSDHPVVIDDLELDMRWPEYRAAVLARTPVRTVLTLQLFEDTTTIGVLNFYANSAYAFDDDSLEDSLIFAACVSLAVSASQRERRLRDALASREAIGQATGILMERHRVDADTAFAILRAMCPKDPDRTISDVAARIVAGDQW